MVAPKPKSPGKVRVYVDMRQANKAVKREHHVTPTVKEMTGYLNGARGFSKLDLNQGYNLLELAPVSRYITTFSTHMGLMRFKRLKFGISSAAEIFQNVIRETLERIDGEINISDDILIFGKTLEEHDHNLKAMFQRLREKGLGILWIRVLSRLHLARPEESCGCRQSSDTINSIRSRVTQPSGDDKLLFKVYP